MGARAGNGNIAPLSGPGRRYSLRPRPWETYVAGVSTVYLFAYSWLALFVGPLFDGIGISLLAGILNLVALGAIIIILAVYRVRRRRVQAKLDRIPSNLLSKNEPFVLYIRPFVTGGRLLCRNTLERAGDRSILGRVWDAELNFAVALEASMPFIAVGGRSRSYGAAKLQVGDDAWQAEVRRLATAAKLVIAVPLAAAGTLWEIRQLFEDEQMRSKTLFFMPPMLRRPFGAWRRTRGHRRLWEDARHSL